MINDERVLITPLTRAILSTVWVATPSACTPRSPRVEAPREQKKFWPFGLTVEPVAPFCPGEHCWRELHRGAFHRTELYPGERHQGELRRGMSDRSLARGSTTRGTRQEGVLQTLKQPALPEKIPTASWINAPPTEEEFAPRSYGYYGHYLDIASKRVKYAWAAINILKSIELP